VQETNLQLKHYFPERLFRAKETLHHSSYGFALYSVAYLQMTPAVDLRPAEVPKPQEGSPSSD